MILQHTTLIITHYPFVIKQKLVHTYIIKITFNKFDLFFILNLRIKIIKKNNNF